MKQDFTSSLSRRERQIMDIIYKKNSATVSEVLEAMPDELSYSTVRAFLRILEEKGHLEHKSQNQKYVYFPKVSKKKAVKYAINNLLKTFFNNSTEQAVAALLENEKEKLTPDDYERICKIIEKAKNEGGE